MELRRKKGEREMCPEGQKRKERCWELRRQQTLGKEWGGRM